MAVPRKSFGQVARGSRSGVAVHDMPHQFSHNVHSTALPCSLLEASWVASSPDCAFLPVWPSTRFLWPPPSRLRGRGSWDVGYAVESAAGPNWPLTHVGSAFRSDGAPGDVPPTLTESLLRARRRKARTYPELVGPHRRARLVVLAVEVGGRWSDETRSFLSQLAGAKARGETSLMRRRAEQG